MRKRYYFGIIIMLLISGVVLWSSNDSKPAYDNTLLAANLEALSQTIEDELLPEKLFTLNAECTIIYNGVERKGTYYFCLEDDYGTKDCRGGCLHVY